MPIVDRIRTAWNAFRSFDEEPNKFEVSMGPSSTFQPFRERARYIGERSIVASIYTRIAIDVSGADIRHISLDDQGRYKNDATSALNDCLTFEPNLDQSPRAFRQDIVMTLIDEGVAAIVPVDTITDSTDPTKIDIYSLRVGRIVEWKPKHVRVSVYNEAKGIREEIVLEKSIVGIVHNPLAAVINEPSSTHQRLLKKLNLLDAVDEQSGSGKLDLIIQLPYTIKTEARRQQAEKRREDIEFQLKGSKYGIAYTDGTENITQLNRPAENNLLKQVEYLTNMLYDQLGITAAVMNGTADEAAMLNYMNRTVEPILDAIVEGMQRAFLGILGKNRKERIRYFRNPFKLVPVVQIAEIADKFARNEIFSSNEIRGFMGVPPSTDPKADQLQNSNMPQPTEAVLGPQLQTLDGVMNDVFDGLSKDLDKVAQGVGDG